MSKFRNSWELAKSSWAILRADKELIALPVLSGLASIVTAVAFFVPILAIGGGVDGEFTFGPVSAVLTGVAYVALAYVTIFFNAALVHAADERMRGGDPTLGSALRGAANRAGRILPWAIVSATVTMILKAIEERAGFVGVIVARIAGIAWSLVTFLVLPVLVIEGIGVKDAVKRSGELFKRTWGEQVVTNAGIGLVGLVAMLAALPLVVVGASVGGPAGIACFVLAGLYLLGVIAVTSALSGIFQTALYHYAANGMPPAAFAGAELREAFVARRR
jgi:hypothetical protein